MDASAISQCQAISGIEDEVTAAQLSSLVTACTPALPSVDVALAFVTAILSVCDFKHPASNRVTAGAVGVIPAVITSLSAHGTVRADVAAIGCEALVQLVFDSTSNADELVSAGALDVAYSVMDAHAGDEAVSRVACWLLWILTDTASPAAVSVMRGGRALELLNAAKRMHPRDGLDTVKYWANRGLASLKP